MFQSFAQNREDVVLARALSGVAAGHYVEAGAYHPSRKSVSYSFYRSGWDGILVEPNPRWHSEFVRRRPRDRLIARALGERTGLWRQLHIPDSSAGLASTDPSWSPCDPPGKAHRVQTVTLSDLLSEVPWATSEFHFMSLDVEGDEERVLDGLDLTRFRPWILVLEAITPGGMGPDRISLFTKRLKVVEYEPQMFDGVNIFFVAEERLNVVRRLYPACSTDEFFDDFSRAPATSRGGSDTEDMAQLLSTVCTSFATVRSLLDEMLMRDATSWHPTQGMAACEQLRLAAGVANTLASRMQEMFASE